MKKSIGARTSLYPAPVMIVVTYDPESRPDAMTAAWGGICCSKPPCIAVSLRRATETYHNLMAREAFTINLPSQDYVLEADYFGTVTGKREEKFLPSGLTPVKSEVVDAPYIAEMPLVLECRLLHTFELGLHTQFIGEILDVKADDAILEAGDIPDLEKLRPLIFAPERSEYYAIGRRLTQSDIARRKELEGL